jgi:hypothetical protein
MIEYTKIREFGNDRKYIIDLEKAEAYKILTGKMTLNDLTIEALEKLGINCIEK